jgi:tetratricopeptide (TPR) repeat protein
MAIKPNLATAQISSSPWLIGPWADLAFFIATPLAIIPAFHVVSLLVPLAILKVIILSISATGHHLPGFIRAYTDPVVYRRFRPRLIIVPTLIVALSVYAAVYKLTIIFFLLIVWGTWHGIMQVHGFLRIYDAKAGIHSRMAARLDFWMCLTWFVQVILWSSGKKMSIFGTFYLAGGPLFPTDAIHAFEAAWLTLTIAVTVLFAVNMIFGATRGIFNPRKLGAMAVSFTFWGYCMVSLDNLIIGLLLWEIFHDLQYNAFVWTYNRSRVRRDLSQSRMERFLFQGNWKRVSIYAACIVVYGSIGILGQDLLGVYENRGVHESALRQLGNIFACSALIHFYLDGFIWKVRDAKVLEDLGMKTDAAMLRPGTSSTSLLDKIGGVAAVKHWSFVILFFAGSIALAASERLHWTASEKAGISSSLVDLIPQNGYAHFMRGTDLAREGKAEAARTHYLKAIALDTNYGFLHELVGELSLGLKDTATAITAYEKARALEPWDGDVNNALATLYMATGRAARAEPAFRALVRLDSTNAAAHYGLAFSLLQQRRGLDAKPYLERSLALDSAQPAALNYLGMVEHAAGNLDRARRLYDAALRLDPAYEHARENRSML